MSLYDYLERMRSESDQKKKRVIVSAMAVAVILVGFLGVLSLKNQFSKAGSFSSSEVNKKEAEDKESIVGPFKSLGKGLALFISDIRDQSSQFLARTSEIIPESSLGEELDNRPVYKLPESRSLTRDN